MLIPGHLLTAIGGTLLLAWHASAFTRSVQVQQARELYYRGIYGDKNAQERSDDLFAELHSQQPNDPLVTVYFASLRLIEAQHTWALWKKNSLSKEGIELMDEAVQQAPSDLEVRFVRAATERNLPGFFGRKEQAASDLRLIVARAPEAVKSGAFEPRLAAASFYFYGEWCKEQSRLRDAEAAWREAVRIAPDSHGGRRSTDELNRLSGKG